MKNIKKLCKQALVIILVCLILSNSTLAFALDLSTTISDVQMEANAMSVFEAKVNEVDSSLTITRTRDLFDFAGNEYTLIECSPVGYFIFHNESGIFTEFSPSSDSPYKNIGASTTLLYGGPTFYYIVEDNSFVHTVISEQLSADNLESYAEKCDEYDSSLMLNKDEAVCNYISSNTSSQGFSCLTSTMGARSTNSTTYVTNASFFYDDNDSNFGYVSGGYCGYIAANLVLRYWDDCGDISLSSTYTSSTGVSRAQLTNALIDIGVDLEYSHDSVPWEIKNVIYEFCEDNDIYARIGYSLLSTGITDEIDSDRPVIVFGNLSASPSTATGNHAVVVYGYYETSTGFTYDIAHFGWSGYGEAYVYGTYGGSTTFRPL